MAAFSRHPLARVVLFTLVSALAVAAQDDSKTFDCKPTIGETKYDLENLASEYELSWENGLPPSVIQDKLTFNLCSALTHKDNVPSDEQCPAGTRACLVRSSKREGKDATVISVIPLANSTESSVSFEQLSSPKGIELTFSGASYPPSVGAAPAQQRLHVRLLCETDKSEKHPANFTSYDGKDLYFEWRDLAGCPFSGPPDGGDTPAPDKGDGEKGEKGEESVGSGLGYFFLLFFLAFVAYFALGAYYNYSTYGATGADLIPHRDFWREVPYMLRDLVSHICSAVRPRQSASRGGYIAV